MPSKLHGAVLSECQRYRYLLTRQWGSGGSTATFIMLNPSTADAWNDDPTIRRCIAYAKAWDCDDLMVVNLYAYRATNPTELWTVDDPIGPEADAYLSNAAAIAHESDGELVAAWGAHARADRIAAVLALPHMRDLTALGTTKSGQPRHPLYLPRGLTPQPWTHPEKAAA